MKQMLLGLMLPLAGVAGLQAATQPTMQDYTQYVNPFVGTGGHGHVFLGANVPFGHIQAILFLLVSGRCTLAARVSATWATLPCFR